MSFKKSFSAIAIATSALIATPSVHAQGIPVIDVANLVQAIQQVTSWGQQYTQMVQQIQQLQSQINAMTGPRGLGTILQDPAIMALLPPEIQTAGAAIANGSFTAAQQSAIDTLMQSYGVTVAPYGATAAPGQSAADALIKMQQVLASAQARTNQVSALANRVDSSVDAKDAADLNNRIGVEQANSINQLTQTLATIEANQRAAELRDTASLQETLRDLLTASQQIPN